MFATALKASDGEDPSPFVGPNTLLGPDGDLSEAVRELIEACDEADKWPQILTGETRKSARGSGQFAAAQSPRN